MVNLLIMEKTLSEVGHLLDGVILLLYNSEYFKISFFLSY